MNLANLLEEKSKIYKNKIAIIYGNKEISYRELNLSILKFANALLKIGIKKGDRVGIILPSCPEFVISYYATLKIGAIAVFLNPLFKKEELKKLLANAKVKVVIAESSLANILKELRINNVILVGRKPIKGFLLYQELIKKESEKIENKEISKDDVAVIIYTSGITDFPKGVMLTHRNLISNINSCIKLEVLKEKDVFLCVLPLFHSYGMTVCMNIPLFLGARIVLMDKFIPQEIAKAIKKYKITIFPGVSTMFNYLINLPGLRKENLKSLKFCFSGAMPLSPEIVKLWEGKFNIPILEGYGPTEASPVASISPLNKRKIGSIGIPVPDVMMKIVDEEGRELKDGEIGEIIIKGENVMKGYFNNISTTNEVLKDGWLYTGDLGKKDEEGYFYIVGRKKEMIIVGGFKVYPEELENVLYSHPKIKEAAVIGVSDKYKGEAVKCFIVPKPRRELTYEEVINFLEERVVSYKIPRHIEFVKELPKDPTGKILKRNLS